MNHLMDHHLPKDKLAMSVATAAAVIIHGVIVITPKVLVVTQHAILRPTHLLLLLVPPSLQLDLLKL